MIRPFLFAYSIPPVTFQISLPPTTYAYHLQTTTYNLGSRYTCCQQPSTYNLHLPHTSYQPMCDARPTDSIQPRNRCIQACIKFSSWNKKVCITPGFFLPLSVKLKGVSSRFYNKTYKDKWYINNHNYRLHNTIQILLKTRSFFILLVLSAYSACDRQMQSSVVIGY